MLIWPDPKRTKSALIKHLKILPLWNHHCQQARVFRTIPSQRLTICKVCLGLHRTVSLACPHWQFQKAAKPQATAALWLLVMGLLRKHSALYYQKKKKKSQLPIPLLCTSVIYLGSSGHKSEEQTVTASHPIPEYSLSNLFTPNQYLNHFQIISLFQTLHSP